MITNVRMSWCQRRAKCAFCPNQIEAGTPLVTVTFWKKGENDRKWNVKNYYHPDCWVAQGLDYLKQNPYIPYQRHKETTLTTTQKARRTKLLRTKASIEQRRRNLKPDNPSHALTVARMDRQIAEMMVEMTKIGGIPEKWLNQLT